MSILNDGILDITGSVAVGAATDIRPASPDEWLVTALGGGVSGGFQGIFQTGDVYLTDGVTDVLTRKSESTSFLARTPQWVKPIRFGLTNSLWLKIKNPLGVAQKYYYGGRISGIGQSGKGDVKNAIVTAVAAGAYVTIQPPAGQKWVYNEVGMTSAGWTDGGSPDRFYPKLSLRIYDGVDEIVVARGVDYSIFNPLRIVFDNSTYLRIYNEDSSARDIGYCCQRII